MLFEPMFKVALFLLVAGLLVQSLAVYLAGSPGRKRLWWRQAAVGALFIGLGVGGGILLLFLPRGISMARRLSPEVLILLFVLWLIGVLVATILVLRKMARNAVDDRPRERSKKNAELGPP